VRGHACACIVHACVHFCLRTCLRARVHSACLPAHDPFQAHTHNSIRAHACAHKLNTCKQQAHVCVDKFACAPFSRSIGSSQDSGPRYLNFVKGVRNELHMRFFTKDFSPLCTEEVRTNKSNEQFCGHLTPCLARMVVII